MHVRLCSSSIDIDDRERGHGRRDISIEHSSVASTPLISPLLALMIWNVNLITTERVFADDTVPIASLLLVESSGK